MKDLAIPQETVQLVGRTFSQFTYTLRTNGDWDNMYVYTDGTNTTGHCNLGRPAQHGDIKHTEYVWRNNAWVQNVIQYY